MKYLILVLMTLMTVSLFAQTGAQGPGTQAITPAGTLTTNEKTTECKCGSGRDAGTGMGTGAAPAGTPPATGTTQPQGTIMDPSNGLSGTTWQGI